MRSLAFAIFVVTFMLATAMPRTSSARAQSGAEDEIYKVRNIKIENKSEDLVLGRETAINEGKEVAFNEMLKRFVNYGYIERAPKFSFGEIEDSIDSVNIIEELLTEEEYEARVNYYFTPRKILSLLGVKHIGVLPKKEDYLLIPVIVEKGKTKPWFKIWMDAWKKETAESINIPLGDLKDLKAVREEDLSILNYNGLDKIARRYKMPVIILAEAEYDIPKNILYVRLKRFEAAPKLVKEYEYPGTFGIGSKELYFTAADDVIADIKKNGIPREGSKLKNPLAEQEIDIEYFRDYQSEKSKDQKTIFATVLTRSLSDWSAVRRKLINTKLINDLSVKNFSAENTEVRIFHIGETDELRRSLATNGLSLLENEGKFVIERMLDTDTVN